MLDPESWSLLAEATRHLGSGFALPEYRAQPADERMRQVLLEVAERMRDNFPYPHPLYAGQMLQPPHPLARLAYALAMQINPNNHALDGGRASSALEKEAVAEIAAMFGWSEHLGHLTSGGTMANLEALWISGQLAPGRLVAASAQAHYTHERICGVLRIPFQKVEVDADARMDRGALRRLAESGELGTLVVTLGTSGLGVLDPLDYALELAEEFGLRIHVDAAYGGYYRLADNLSERGRRLFDLLERVDSIVIDPHKHGLQPYGCGCVLFRDPQVGRFYKHDSPYTYFSSDELHLGEISLECSRAGAGAVALWATQRLLPLVAGGEFAHRLESSRGAALGLYRRLHDSPHWITPWEPDLDIVVWLPRAQSASAVSASTRRIYAEAARRDLHLAVTQVPRPLLERSCPELVWDSDTVACLRSCLMRPEHEQWLDQIWLRLEQARQA